MLSITAENLYKKISTREDITLIDVRETYERDAFNIGGVHIPLGNIVESTALIPAGKPVVFYCQKGIRSMIAIQRLQQRFHYDNLINLAGGIDAWRQEIGYSCSNHDL